MIAEKKTTTIWSARRSSTCASPPPIRCCTTHESSALQYAMRDRLAGLGWSEIEIIDEDLAVRPPAACSVPASIGWWLRFASASRRGLRPRGLASPATAGTGSSWSRMCRVVDTVLVDQEAIAPRHARRPLLGLKEA